MSGMQRDPKGLSGGELQHLTGLSDPYEESVHPDVVVDTDCETPDRSVETILWSLTAMRVG
jgi:adenylylsulfate kinase